MGRTVTSDSPFQAFDWWLSYLAILQTDELFTLVAYDTTGCRGIAPLVRSGAEVRPICDHLTDHSLLWLGDDDVGAAFMATLRRHGVRRVRGYGLSHRPRALAAYSGWRRVPCPVLALDGDCTTAYSPGLRARLRNSQPALSATGPLTLRVRQANADRMGRFLDRLDAWCTFTKHPERAMRDGRRRFALSWTASPALAPRTLLATLRAGASHVSTLLCFRYSGSLGVYATAHSPALARLSPGLHGTDALLRWAAANGFCRYDFLRGAEPYKARFGAREGYDVFNADLDLD